VVALDVLKKPFKETQLAKEDILPQVFDKIASHIEKEEMPQAVEQILAVFEEGNFDMRLVSYYLYAHFLQKGFMSFNETLPIFKSLIIHEWESLRPIQRKDRQVESSFNWYFTHVINKLKYNERLMKEKKQLLWASTHVSEKEFDELEKTLQDFMIFFHEKWAESPVKERVTHLVKKIGDLKPMILQEKIEEVVEDKLVEEETSEPEEKVELTAMLIAPSQPGLFESSEMMTLLKKLKTFEKLIEKGEFLKAAVVSNDLTQIISNFDPCAYFPKVFATYFNLLAKHSSSITDESNSQETLQWKSLDRLYKADVDQFVGW
jgi:hypothetical protein